MMECPKCQAPAKVYTTKPHGSVKQRYRKCSACGHRFATWEEPDGRVIRDYVKAKPEQGPGLFDDVP